jgi:hypothetical protein
MCSVHLQLKNFFDLQLSLWICNTWLRRADCMTVCIYAHIVDTHTNRHIYIYAYTWIHSCMCMCSQK